MQYKDSEKVFTSDKIRKQNKKVQHIYLVKLELAELAELSDPPPPPLLLLVSIPLAKVQLPDVGVNAPS